MCLLIFTKNKIRSQLISKRKSLNQDFIYKKSLKLKEKIFDIISLKSYNVAFYYPINGELDPIPAIKYLSEQHSLSLPKVIKNSRILEFIPFEFGDKLHKNQKINHLLEPSRGKAIIPDIVLVPLVAIDKKNNRIGMGGGYYDATISYYRKSNFTTIFIGVAYDFQLLEGLIEVDSYDQKLDKIILV
jgi:5-formyltetrahydrofolate cyclo-ligase